MGRGPTREQCTGNSKKEHIKLRRNSHYCITRATREQCTGNSKKEHIKLRRNSHYCITRATRERIRLLRC